MMILTAGLRLEVGEGCMGCAVSVGAWGIE